jgi:prepilin-type processing-associated H-X9-DG protein
MLMYLDSYNNIFPGCASRTTYGFHVEDWIYWRTSMPAYPVTKSLILAGIGSFNTNVFRCPGDKNDKDRKAVDGTDAANGIYYYSYTLTSIGVGTGLTSINDGSLHTFKSTDVTNPSGKIMFAEEQTVLSGPECTDPLAPIADDGRFAAPGDVLTSRHNKRADVGFCDGHVSAVLPTFSNLANNVQPLLY